MTDKHEPQFSWAVAATIADVGLLIHTRINNLYEETNDLHTACIELARALDRAARANEKLCEEYYSLTDKAVDLLVTRCVKAQELVFLTEEEWDSLVAEAVKALAAAVHTLGEIHAALDAGKKVYWQTHSYAVVRHSNGELWTQASTGMRQPLKYVTGCFIGEVVEP